MEGAIIKRFLLRLLYRLVCQIQLASSLHFEAPLILVESAADAYGDGRGQSAHFLGYYLSDRRARACVFSGNCRFTLVGWTIFWRARCPTSAREKRYE